MLTRPNKLVEASFRKPYTHGLTKKTAYVNANVVIKPSGEFRIDVISAHDTMGSGAVAQPTEDGSYVAYEGRDT
jgi:hypothetical protein